MAYTKEEKEQYLTEIFELVASNMSLKNAVNHKEIFPTYQTIFEWINADKKVEKAYLIAQACRHEQLFDETLDIADDQEGDTYIDDRTGEEKVNTNVIQRAKLRIDARQWALARMNPAKFSERLFTHNEIEAKEADLDLSKLTTEELLMHKQLFEKAKIKKED
ncbi:phage terminase small subunit [Cellulophaga phage phi12:1]|uniref:Phage terminase small subunit n=2 Tax=Cellulophaga phage phi12:1 TaxID=1327976 RepID=S0A1A9_9CAUD|nr:terminase small subunit [Cellulophaga phage phi12:1]AGO47998.1 phage terminase small subunit [Cellulophaga phage phi12:1]AGO48163.1 phage terminase small subunit [Cellulophaga phage phi12:3]